MQPVIDPPFGTYALPSEREAWRLKAGQYGDSRIGRALISRCRKKALSGLTEPFDVEVAPGVNARLYPSGNRCEKRAFAGVQVWDAVERLALQACVDTAPQPDFVFLDVGANVGLYSLFVAAYCRAEGKDATILAIEPSIETCQRLADNIASNEAPVKIIRAAISDKPGSGHLKPGVDNRGEARLTNERTGGEVVVIDTLTRIARVNGLTHINAMKVDIEGHDLLALQGFFKDAPKRLYPDLLILETGREATTPLIELCQKHGYEVKARSGINSILVKTKSSEI